MVSYAICILISLTLESYGLFEDSRKFEFHFDFASKVSNCKFQGIFTLQRSIWIAMVPKNALSNVAHVYKTVFKKSLKMEVEKTLALEGRKYLNDSDLHRFF